MCCCPKKIERYWKIVRKIQQTGKASEEEKKFIEKMTHAKKGTNPWHSV